MRSVYSKILSTGSCSSGNIASATNDPAKDPATTVNMAEVAARQALEDAELSPRDIDFLVVGTTSPDLVFPNAGCLLQERLGLSGSAAFSVEAGDTGFIYALSIADQFISTRQAKCALVIGAETFVRDRDAPCDMIAAAGAMILESAVSAGVLLCHLGADRQLTDISVGVTRSALEELRIRLEEALRGTELDGAEIDGLLIQHSDSQLVGMAAEHLRIATNKIILSSEIHGDPAAATMPLGLDRAIRDGRVGRGDLLLLLALGGAVTWGASLIRL